MRITAEARANIALVKYWGNRDAALNLPASGSLSVTLDGLVTRTTVSLLAAAEPDQLLINASPVGPEGLARATRVLDAVRALADDGGAPMLIRSENNFPTAAGLASSASGMAALAVAASSALGLTLPPERISALARLGSGSGCRSIFGGFTRWLPGLRPDGLDSHAEQLFEADHWDLRVVVAVVQDAPKAVSSAAGMAHTAATSPYHSAWLAGADQDLEQAMGALEARDLASLGRVAERSCLRMHANMAAADPPLVYLSGDSWQVIEAVRRLQAEGVPAFFTADAGPNVKVFCEADAVGRVSAVIRAMPCVKTVIHARPGPGARVVQAGD